ncbi:MAG: hypothetical protein MZW92_61125 [Comamonadaceae bacterium]|nr:hypothetical protein [Comamonadaceae bacterium]
MTKSVQALAGANKALVRVESIGKSRGGRDLWAIEIAGPGAVPPGKRPALLVAAGFEGDDLTGTELALAVAEHLARNAAGDPAVKARLEASTVYVLPRINPDGAEGFFAPLKTGQRTNANPFDDDNDGRVDEDGPEDLNGDGFITVMRVPAAGGEYMADPDEPRLMKQADPEEGRDRAPSGSLRKGSTTTATASSTRIRRAASTSAGTSPTNTPTISPAPARTWSARPKAGP